MTIADRIRNRRLELGLSVDDLAEKLHKNRATVYRYESNYIKTYSYDVMEALAEALSTTPAYFYGFDDAKLTKDYILTQAQKTKTDAPKTSEARIVSCGMDKLPKSQREQILNVVRAMFAQHPELFEDEKGGTSHE